LDDRGSIRDRGRNSSIRHRVWTLSVAHPASYPLRTGGFFPGVKRPGREAGHSPPSSTEVKNAWNYTSTPPFFFMVWCLVKHRDFTFSLCLCIYSCPSLFFPVPFLGTGAECDSTLWLDVQFVRAA